MFHQLNRVQKPLTRPASTTVVFRFIGGQERMHRFPGIQGGWRLDLKLDALMDEMDEDTVMSPISNHQGASRWPSEDRGPADLQPERMKNGLDLERRQT